MKLSQMRYFSAVCHAGNISRAAEELHISQPSVTTAIKALEDELGVSLLHRGNRAVTPTPDGERFLRRCDAILVEVDGLSEEYQELSRKHKTISVGIPNCILYHAPVPVGSPHAAVPYAPSGCLLTSTHAV